MMPLAAVAGGTTFDAADTWPAHSAMTHPTIAKVLKTDSFWNKGATRQADG